MKTIFEVRSGKPAGHVYDPPTRPGDTQSLIISNPTLIRKWGWGYSTTPVAGEATTIEYPDHPDYVGTIRQVQAAIAADKTFAAIRSGGTLYSTRWFYDGHPIAMADGVPFGEWLLWLQSMTAKPTAVTLTFVE